MTRQEIETHLETLQSKLTNIKIMLAVPMAIIMFIYFFTYGTLIDMGFKGILYFEISSSILFFLVLFNLNIVSYQFLKLFLARNKAFKPLFSQLNAKSINTPLDQLTDIVAKELSP